MSACGTTSESGHADPWKTKEVRVTMRATLRPVNLVQVLQRELQLGRERLDAVAQFTLGQGRKLVEQGLDDRGIDDDHDDLERQPG